MLSATPNTTWHWQAIDSTRNIARDYHLSTSQDLFGWTIVERRWGRIGGRLTTRCDVFASKEGALALIRSNRQRRASAERRISAAYRLM